MSAHAAKALAPSTAAHTRSPLVRGPRDRDGRVLLLPPAARLLLDPKRAGRDARGGRTTRGPEAGAAPAARGPVEPRGARPGSGRAGVRPPRRAPVHRQGDRRVAAGAQ